MRLRQFRVAFIELLLKKNHSESEEFEKKMFGSLNAVANVVANQGGEREEQNVNQVNVNVNIKTVQGGEREQQNVNQVNTNVNIKTAQGGEREEQNVNQVKIETKDHLCTKKKSNRCECNL